MRGGSDRGVPPSPSARTGQVSEAPKTKAASATAEWILNRLHIPGEQSRQSDGGSAEDREVAFVSCGTRLFADLLCHTSDALARCIKRIKFKTVASRCAGQNSNTNRYRRRSPPSRGGPPG